MDPEVQGCGDEMEDEEGAEDLGLEAGVKNLGEAGQLPLIRDKEAWMDVDLDPPPLRRPSLLSHLSIASTETIEGNSSEGNTFSVNSQESGLIPQSSATPSSAPGDNNQVSRSEWKHGKSFSNDFRPATRSLPTLPCPPTASSQLAERVVPPLLALSVNNFPPEIVSISCMSLDGEDAAPSPSELELAQMESKGSSPVSDGALAVAGTMFESVEAEPEKRMTESNKVQSVAPETSGLPSSVLTGNSKDRRPSNIRELRPEDAIHDWHNDEETEGYRQVYEHRKEIREQSRFRSPAVTPREAPDQSTFPTYFGSSYSRSAKGKEGDRLPADDFDLLQEDCTPSEGRPRKVRQDEQNRQASPQSHYSNTSEHDRATFDSAIRALQKGVHFQPRTIPPRDSVKARGSTSCATLRDRGQPCETAPAQFQGSSTLRHSPRLGSHERIQGLSRRPSTKRAHSHMMSWDKALLSPAPQDDLVEENQPDRQKKAMGLAMSPGSATLDVNIIEQAFTAGIASTDSGRKVVAEGGITSNILNNIVGYPRPASPSAATASSVSTAGSRRQFSSYKGSSLPEIQATTTHTELFYLAFGNGGSSSRQSLTGRTVQKKRERAENHKADRDLRAADKLEKEERRKQPYNDKFERPANDDTTTESQSESVSEGHGSSVEDSGTSNRAKTMSNDNGCTEDDEERRRIRQESCAKRRARQPRSPEQIVSAAVIMPVTGMIILKDGGAISNEAESRTATAHKSGTAPPVSEKSSGSSVQYGPKVQNSGQTLHPHGTFTTARHPSMTIHADAIRARALVTDERFDTINTDQLQAAADAGDQIAEAHLRQRQRRSRMVTSQEKLPADAMPAERPLRNRPPAIEGGSRRKSSVASPTSLIPRKPMSPVLQTIQEGGAVNLASTQAERKISRDITSQVEQLESRRSSGSTISSGRLSSVSIDSAVEALFEAIGNKNVPINLPIKLLPLTARSRSMDQTAPDAADFQTTRSGSVPTTPLEFAASKRSPFVSNPALRSGQELYRVHAFPPVTSPHTLTSYAETTPIRRDLNLFVAQPRRDPFSPTSESELFLDVGRLTSRQVEKDRALDRAQDARNKGLATESLGNQRARAEATQRSRVRESVRNANVTADTDAPQEESDIVSAMASFGISYETRRRPSVDNSLDPLAQEETKEQRLAAHQQRKRMRRKLEHERVIRETPMGEYSNPFDTHLGGLSREKKADVVQTSQVAESICEEDEGVDARSTSVFASTAADMARGEG